MILAHILAPFPLDISPLFSSLPVFPKQESDAKGGKEHEKDSKKAHEAESLPIKVEVGKRVADQSHQTFFDCNFAYTRCAPHSDEVVINGDDDHVHIHDKDRHHDNDPDKVIVKGDNEHVHIHLRRRHRHHGWHDGSKVIINGDHDRVNVHYRCSSPAIPSSSLAPIAPLLVVALKRWNDVSTKTPPIALMLNNDAGAQKKLGSLYINTNKKPFEMDASETNATTTYMLADTGSGLTVRVGSLETENAALRGGVDDWRWRAPRWAQTPYALQSFHQSHPQTPAVFSRSGLSGMVVSELGCKWGETVARGW
ncbi:hypothetical protein BDZ89DRAFT_1152395 [Hymenopellis radicata]|nr:hypothetical protein BDZ89DRAFT_1152395 [Hymenopellis radicata]